MPPGLECAMTTETRPADRFDLPVLMQEFLNTAIKLRVLDAADVWALTLNHGSDFVAIRNEVMKCAYSWIHVDAQRHSEMCTINDKCCVDMVSGSATIG